jgi:hypothetical protein
LTGRRPRRELGIVLALYAVTAIGWVWGNPVFEAPDEPFHVGYANFLLREGRWPHHADIETTLQFFAARAGPGTAAEIFEAGQGRIVQEWQQPPLYYLLQAVPLAGFYPRGFEPPLIPLRPRHYEQPARGFFQDRAPRLWDGRRPVLAVRCMRLLSAVLGGCVVWLTARLAARVIPDCPAAVTLAAGLLALIPQFTFMAASVDNDVLGYLASAAGVAGTLAVAEGRWPAWRAGSLLGLLGVVGFLSKATTLFLWPLGVLAAGLAYRRWRDRAACVIIMVAWGLALVLPYLAGRRAPMEAMAVFLLQGSSPAMTFETPFWGFPPERTVAYAGQVLAMLAESFWGQFGWSQVPLARGALGLYWLGVLVALGGWGTGRGPAGGCAPDRRALRLCAAALGLFFLGVVIVYLRVYTPQGGRYLLTVGPILTVLWAIGLMNVRGLAERWLRRPVPPQAYAWCVVAAMTIVNWAVLWGSVWRAYARAWEA